MANRPAVVLVLFALLLAMPVGGKGPHSPYIDPSEFTVTYSGQVTDDAGTALPNATVKVLPRVESGVWPSMFEAYATSVTDPGGRYTMRGPPGDMTLLAAAHDSIASLQDVAPDAHAKLVTPLKVLRIPEPSIPVIGRLVDAATGDAIRYGTVTIEQRTWGTSNCIVTPALQQAREREARAIGVSPDTTCAASIASDGTFLLMARPGHAVLTATEELGPVCSWTTTATDSHCLTHGHERWVRTIVLDQLGANIEASLRDRTPDAHMRVEVVDQRGRAVEGASVHVVGAKAQYQGTTTAAGVAEPADGMYGAGAPPRLASGHYEVVVQREGFLEWMATMQVVPGENRLRVELLAGEPVWDGCCWRHGSGTLDSGAPPGTQVETAGRLATVSPLEQRTAGAADVLLVILLLAGLAIAVRRVSRPPNEP